MNRDRSLLGEGSSTDPFPDQINVFHGRSEPAPNLISMKAAYEMADYFYGLGLREGVGSSVNRLRLAKVLQARYGDAWTSFMALAEADAVISELRSSKEERG